MSKFIKVQNIEMLVNSDQSGLKKVVILDSSADADFITDAEILAEYNAAHGQGRFHMGTTTATSIIDQVEVDERGEAIRIGHACTKPGCPCTGWWEPTGETPIGETKILNL